VTLGANQLQVSESDPAWTQCNGASGIYSKEFGLHCENASVPAPQPAAENRPGYVFFYDVTVIMPDQSHLVLHCSTVLDHGCEGFPAYPESTSVVCSDFVYSGTAYKDCTATGPSPKGIGVYKAAVHGDRVTIFGSNWHRHFQQHGTWQFRQVAAQGQKPILLQEKPDPPLEKPDPTLEKPDPPRLKADPPQETNPCPRSTVEQEPQPAPPDQKPDPFPETKPAPDPSPEQEPKPTPAPEQPVSPQETTPDPATTPEEQTKASIPTATALSMSAGADHVVDPRVIEQAKAGDRVAQYKLGYNYYLGRGVALDYVQAAIWWRKAADQGYPDAQNNLGVLYNSGKGVPQSYAEAYFWENLAAARASGTLQAQFAKNRDESGSKLWFYERSKVQKRAEKWAAEHPVPPRSAEPKPDHE
jgi:hypothetical protein